MADGPQVTADGKCMADVHRLIVGLHKLLKEKSLESASVMIGAM